MVKGERNRLNKPPCAACNCTPSNPTFSISMIASTKQFTISPISSNVSCLLFLRENGELITEGLAVIFPFSIWAIILHSWFELWTVKGICSIPWTRRSLYSIIHFCALSFSVRSWRTGNPPEIISPTPPRAMLRYKLSTSLVILLLLKIDGSQVAERTKRFRRMRLPIFAFENSV